MIKNKYFAEAKRIVIKIGSALLVNSRNGRVKKDWLDSIVEDVVSLRKDGKEVIIVSSGAVAVGRKPLGFSRTKKLHLEEKQACASAGQLKLAHDYDEAFSYYNIPTAQILLTLGDTENRRRHLNARNTIDNILKHGAVPIINENDAVATEEIRFGDNDRLAARVSQMCGADILILLSDIDGLYTKNPKIHNDAEFIPEIKEITPEIKDMAGASVTECGTGGMVTKIMAAEIATRAGCKMVIALGSNENPIEKIINNAKCSWFLPQTSSNKAKKNWIAGTLKTSGKIVIDKGAEDAIKKGSSLLPVGVVDVEGVFDIGDTISVFNIKGQEIAKGITAYSAEDVEKIMGHKSEEIEKILGFKGREQIIRENYMVVF
ncbi:MAG: glutamate 5-kinase [Alphaproteobacteria bacterium]